WRCNCATISPAITGASSFPMARIRICASNTPSFQATNKEAFMSNVRRTFAFAAAIAFLGLAPAAAQHIDADKQAEAQGLKTKAGLPADPQSTAKVDPMRGYYGNTYSCYWPDTFQCRHWWNADGTETYFEARWAPEGVITMKTIEGRYKV